MDDGAVLYRGASAHCDGAVVAAKDGSRPNAGFGADRDIADDDGVRMDKSLGVDLWRDAFDLVDGHGWGRYTWPAIQVTPW